MCSEISGQHCLHGRQLYQAVVLLSQDFHHNRVTRLSSNVSQSAPTGMGLDETADSGNQLEDSIQLSIHGTAHTSSSKDIKLFCHYRSQLSVIYIYVKQAKKERPKALKEIGHCGIQVATADSKWTSSKIELKQRTKQQHESIK